MFRSMLVSACIVLSSTSSYAGGIAVCLWSPDREVFSQPVNYTYRWCASASCTDWKKSSLFSLSNPYERSLHYRELETEGAFYIKFDSSFEDGYQEEKYMLDPDYFILLKGNSEEICDSKAAYKFVLTGNGIDLKKGCPRESSSCGR